MDIDPETKDMPYAIVVVPCYNEANRIPSDQFLAFDSDRHNKKFIFVNDGSADSTLRVVESLHARAPARYSVHNLTRNVGKAEATRAGLLLAFQENPDYVGFWDTSIGHTPRGD